MGPVTLGILILLSLWAGLATGVAYVSWRSWQERELRVSSLEEQVDELHSQGLQVSPPSTREAAKGPTADELLTEGDQEWLDGIEDPAHKQELREYLAFVRGTGADQPASVLIEQMEA